MALIVAFSFCLAGCGLMILAPWNVQAQYVRIIRDKVNERK